MRLDATPKGNTFVFMNPHPEPVAVLREPAERIGLLGAGHNNFNRQGKSAILLTNLFIGKIQKAVIYEP